MDWQNVLKRKIETLADYTNASPEERRRYHTSMMNAYYYRLKTLRNSIANVGETNPNIPLEEDMRKLQEMANFHSRQRGRIKVGSSIPDVFSPELEEQRRKQKLIVTPRGVPNPYTDLSTEEYEQLTNKQKENYHDGRRKATSGEEKRFHWRMRKRLQDNSSLPTFPTPDLEGERNRIYDVNETKEEYDNMSREDKRKDHNKMKSRFYRNNNRELYGFHGRMASRLRTNSPQPTFYSPEHEEEE